MGAKSDVGSVGISPGANAEDVANLVAVHVGERQFREAGRQPLATRRFAPRRRGNGGHIDLRVFQLTAVRAKPSEGLVYAAQLGNARNLLLGRTGSLGFACERRSYWRTWSHGVAH